MGSVQCGAGRPWCHTMGLGGAISSGRYGCSRKHTYRRGDALEKGRRLMAACGGVYRSIVMPGGAGLGDGGAFARQNARLRS